MKKLLLIAILMLALVFVVVACDKTPDTTDTTVADTTETPTEAPDDATTEAPTEETPTDPAEETTEAPTEETPTEAPTTAKPEDPTEPPTEDVTTVDPAEPVLMLDPDALNTLAGAGAPNVNQIGTPEVLTEGNKTFLRLTAAGGDPYVAIIPLNSNYILPQYMAISYRTNSATNGQFFMGSGAGWSGQGDAFGVDWAEGDWSFMIIDLTKTGVTSLTEDGKITYARLDFFVNEGAEGDYFDVQYVGFFNTPEYALAYDFEINPPYAQLDEAGKKGVSFDTFYVNGEMYFPDGGADAKLDEINNTLTFASASELQNIALRGWIGFDQAIDQFGYYVDNYEFVFGEYKQATEDGVLAAGGEFATRFQINVDLSALKGDDHFVGFVVKLADGTIVQLREDITIDLPELPKDITDTFISDVASNAEGTDLKDSDLANFFTVTYGASEPHKVEGGAYNYGGINEMYADVNGKYAYSVNMLSAGASAMMFVRGTHVVHSVDVPTAADGETFSQDFALEINGTNYAVALYIKNNAGEYIVVDDSGFDAIPFFNSDYMGLYFYIYYAAHTATISNCYIVKGLSFGEYEVPETTPAPETTAAPETEAPVTEAPETEAPETEAPATEAPVETTVAPTTTAPTTEAPKAEGGCGGFVALGVIAALIPAAVVVLKKRD